MVGVYFYLRSIDMANCIVTNINFEALLEKHLNFNSGFFVDIGASDGITDSNSYKYANSENWSGISIEFIQDKYHRLIANQPSPRVKKINAKVTPDNIVDILRENNCPRIIDLMSLDIDGYDYYVLESLLSNYDCRVAILEINEKIPVPIKFSVSYDLDYFWDGTHFYGMSLSKLNDLAEMFNYTIVDYLFNNVVMVKNDYLSPEHKKQSIEELYNSGYRKNPSVQPAYNNDVKFWLDLSPEDAVTEINKFFYPRQNYKINL